MNYALLKLHSKKIIQTDRFALSVLIIRRQCLLEYSNNFTKTFGILYWHARNEHSVNVTNLSSFKFIKQNLEITYNNGRYEMQIV